MNSGNPGNFGSFGKAIITVASLFAAACSNPAPSSTVRETPARNLLIVTIDTLRSDHVGAYGYARARTPTIDALAARGVRFERAYAAAPITLTSHASLMTGRYPPGHGARHNGMRLDLAVPTLADVLARAGFQTGAFVAAFPLDHRFGINKGFGVYGDRMPRSPQGRLASERPGRAAIDEAIEWLGRHRHGRFFLWTHLFEPHAPYGDPSNRRPVEARYDDEIAEADRQMGRLMEALGTDGGTLVVFASDHGEAFGEHGEIGHSIFVYDTTLRVPLIIAGRGLQQRVVDAPVSLVDVAPTVLRLLDIPGPETDGIDLGPVMAGQKPPARALYAESFAPLLDFGWSPLRTLRSEGFKYIAAPAAELYDVTGDPDEAHNLANRELQRLALLRDQIARVSSDSLAVKGPSDPEAAARLRSLGYVSRDAGAPVERADPKDRRDLAARIAQVTSGELQGAALERALQEILAEDPGNAQAHLRLGYVLADTKRCAAAEPHFRAAIAAHLPTADAHLGLASCQTLARRFAGARETLRAAEIVEPDNPVVIANHGLVLSDAGRAAEAIPLLKRALTLDPDFHEARFNLALAYARGGRREDAAKEASELLHRLPANAPQRREVERLLAAVR